MELDNIRWKQRFANYLKALSQLSRFIEKGDLNELEKQGLIQSFEYTYELAWNVIKDFYEYQGMTDIQGSRDAIRTAFKMGLIDDGNGWMQMIGSRIKSSHTYNEEIAQEINDAIQSTYFDLFIRFKIKMESFL